MPIAAELLKLVERAVLDPKKEGKNLTALFRNFLLNFKFFYGCDRLFVRYKPYGVYSIREKFVSFRH